MTYQLHPVTIDTGWLQFKALRDFWDAQKNLKPFNGKIKQGASAAEALVRGVPPVDTQPPASRDQVTEVDFPPASVTEPHLTLVVGYAGGSDPELRDRWLRQRIKLLSAPALESLAPLWPVNEVLPPGQHPEPYSEQELAILIPLVDHVEAQHGEPFGTPDPGLPPAPAIDEWTTRPEAQVRPDEGEEVDPNRIGAIATALSALTTSQQAFIEDVCIRALKYHGYSMNLSAGTTRRKWLTARALIWMVEIFDKEADALGAALAGGDLGEWCAYSPIEDTTTVLHMLIELRAGHRALAFDTDGTPTFPLADQSNRVTLTDDQVAQMLEAS